VIADRSESGNGPKGRRAAVVPFSSPFKGYSHIITLQDGFIQGQLIRRESTEQNVFRFWRQLDTFVRVVERGLGPS